MHVSRMVIFSIRNIFLIHKSIDEIIQILDSISGTTYTSYSKSKKPSHTLLLSCSPCFQKRKPQRKEPGIMANQQTLELIRQQTVDEWNLFRFEHPEEV